jgi:dipeptidase E
MKLYLSSQGLPASTQKDFLGLFDKSASEINIAHIADAAVPYENDDLSWLTDSRADLLATGVAVEELSLRDYAGKPSELAAKLSGFDGVWIAGGNCYYLRYWMRVSGFDQIIRSLLDKGFVYAGFSAAAMVAGPTIEHTDHDGEAHLEPEAIKEGLGLVDFLTLPHWDRGDAEAAYMHELRRLSGVTKTQELRDGEAIVCNDGQLRVLTMDIAQ